MRRLAALLALVLLSGCTDGGGGARPTASPSPTATVPVGGLLLYATDREVYALPPDGTPRLVARTDGEVHDLDVSADGRYVAWVAAPYSVTVTVHDLADGRSRTWTPPSDAYAVRWIGRRGDDFVAVPDSGDRLLAFSPERILAGEPPAETPLTGVTGASLLATDGERVLVATMEEASAYGGPQTVYDVAPDGTARRLFTDGDGLPEGEVRNLPMSAATLTADGTRLVYGAGATPGAYSCEALRFVVVRDLRTGREVDMPSPSLGADVAYAVATITTGHDGRTVVGLTSDLGDMCPQADRAAAYALDGPSWRQVANGATWAARGPGARLATLTNAGLLTVAGRRIRGGVARAVWSPV